MAGKTVSKTPVQKKNTRPAGKPAPAKGKATPQAKARPASKAAAKEPRGASSRGARPAAKTRPAGGLLSGLFHRQPEGKSTASASPSAPMSLDQKLNILGVVLVFAGLGSALGLLSPINSDLVGGWITLMAQSFGWGMYFFPFCLIVAGLWLILRNFERIPQLQLERVIGFALLYANLLAIAHWVVMVQSGHEALAIAQAGQGGGLIGALFTGLLTAGLGIGAAAIALLAWFLISLSLTLDLTVVEMLQWSEPPLRRVQEQMRLAWERWRGRGAAASTWPGPTNGYKPLPPMPPGEAAAGAVPAAGITTGVSGDQAAVAWVLPPIAEILDAGAEVAHDDDDDRQRARLIEETLESFGAPARVVEINRGPTITQFGVEPDFIETRGGRMRVRVGKISALADDLALALSARTIRIQAPVPGKGYVGIEVPNEETARVALRDVIESEGFRKIKTKSPLGFALGQNVAGVPISADLAAMPHLLIAGATGSGKSVCVNALISCLLINNTPDDLRLIMVDPKRVELTGYNGIPHLLAPVVVELEKVVAALQWVTREMDMRYRKLSEAGCRNIQDFNAKAVAAGQRRLPYLVVIIDELADLMMLAPDETERTVTRLAQLARATGIHLVIATQRPSVDVVTGLIKANFPARVAFAVASGVDSRVILDQPGAERLLGRGDMLFQAPDSPAPVRLQGVFVSDSEILHLVTYWQAHAVQAAQASSPAQMGADGAPDALPSGVPLKQIALWEEEGEDQNADPLLNEAIDLSRRQGRASISMLQRRLRIGYTRAARLIEIMEEKKLIGAADPNTGVREILDYGPAGPPVDGEHD